MVLEVWYQARSTQDIIYRTDTKNNIQARNIIIYKRKRNIIVVNIGRSNTMWGWGRTAQTRLHIGPLNHGKESQYCTSMTEIKEESNDSNFIVKGSLQLCIYTEPWNTIVKQRDRAGIWPKVQEALTIYGPERQQ